MFRGMALLSVRTYISAFFLLFLARLLLLSLKQSYIFLRPTDLLYRCAGPYWFLMHKSRRPDKENTLHLAETRPHWVYEWGKSNQTQWCRLHLKLWSTYVHDSHTTAHRNQRKYSKEACMFPRLPPALPIWFRGVGDAKVGGSWHE